MSPCGSAPGRLSPPLTAHCTQVHGVRVKMVEDMKKEFPSMGLSYVIGKLPLASAMSLVSCHSPAASPISQGKVHASRDNTATTWNGTALCRQKLPSRSPHPPQTSAPPTHSSAPPTHSSAPPNHSSAPLTHSSAPPPPHRWPNQH